MSPAKKCFKDWVNRQLRRTGYQLVNMKAQPFQPTLPSALHRLAARHPQFRTVIDVGASDGHWSRQLAAALPGPKNFVMIEAQTLHRDGLARFQADFAHTRTVLAAAGSQPGEIYFEANDPWGGVAAEQPGNQDGNWIRVPMTTIDQEVAASGFPGPYLIKLDTHGYEVPILDGAKQTLAQTEVLVIECYNFNIAASARRFPAFCLHLEELGFRCIDLFDPFYRPSDGTLWQMDLVFMRGDRPEFKPAASFPPTV
ncbi:MAG TPA: FkbM family methyltransferase [Opitutaceae bacterium]|jgi:FkbM family methyltransferase|nr:FkbM family methyltransferase [Opitutaceae bacterium]